MTYPTSGEQAWMKDMTAQHRPDLVTVVRDVRHTDGAGGSTAAIPTTVGTYNVRFEDATAKELQQVGIQADVTTVVAAFPTTAVLSLKDRFTLADGREFEIVSLGTPDSIEIERRVIGVETR